MFYNHNFKYKINGKQGTRWLKYGFCTITDMYVVQTGWFTETDNGIDISKKYKNKSKLYEKQVALAKTLYNDRFNHLNELGCVLEKTI